MSSKELFLRDARRRGPDSALPDVSAAYLTMIGVTEADLRSVGLPVSLLSGDIANFKKSQSVGKSEFLASSSLMPANVGPRGREFDRKSVSAFRQAVRRERGGQ